MKTEASVLGLRIGDVLEYQGIWYSRDGLAAESTDLAAVIELHPRVPGTGQLLRIDPTGQAIYDNGDAAYVVVRFANGLRHAIGARDLKRNWQRTSLSAAALS